MPKNKTLKREKRAVFSNTHLLVASVILLLVVFEALYLLRDQHIQQANSGLMQEVAGVATSR